MEYFKETCFTNINELKKFFEEKSEIPQNIKGQIIDFIRENKLIEFHRKLSKVQRESYAKMQKDKSLLTNSILIDFDFKQKILIGMSPRQTNDEYYVQKQRNVFG